MKKLISIAVFCMLLGVVATVTRPLTDRRTPIEKFREAMQAVDYHTFYDKDFGYSFEYPSFLKQDDIPEYGIGHVQFSYHDRTDIVMECKVVPESVYHYKDKDFVVEGEVEHCRDFRYYAHYICRDRRWYTLTLFYHAPYRDAIKSLMFRVAGWKADTCGQEKKVGRLDRVVGERRK